MSKPKWEVIDGDTSIKTTDPTVFEYYRATIPIGVRPFFQIESFKTDPHIDVILVLDEVEYKAYIGYSAERNVSQLIWHADLAGTLNHRYPNIKNTKQFPKMAFRKLDDHKYSIELLDSQEYTDSEAILEPSDSLGTYVPGYKNEYSPTVKKSKNIIFRGAPGTGKSYLAKAIAADIVSDGETQKYDELTNVQKTQIEFVQFHPSYDYTDFVEGLRPKQTDDGSIGFELQDGIFKKFVAKAIKSRFSGTDNFDETWDKLINRLGNEDPIEVPLIRGGKSFPIVLNDYGTGLATRTYDDENNKISGKSRFYNKEQLYNIYRGLPGVPGKGHDNYRRAIIEYMKNEFELEDFSYSEDRNPTSYVFIIDEINRGEISKILGELFFALDPGYRGDEGKVSTQYANLHENPEEKFFIPDNVYIIGTMNDIDRSVDSFDFAMRRRFRFIEIKANDNTEMLNELQDKKEEEEAISRMKALNEAISKIDELNDNYHIGAAYFLKLKEISFEELWSDYLEPLLQDYIRGMYNEKEILDDLEKAYNKPGASDENNIEG
jgi:hypothetical protein